MTIWLGTEGTPGLFSSVVCGLTSKGLALTNETGDVVVPNPNDVSRTAWIERATKSLSASVSGRGVLAEETFFPWIDWLLSGLPREVGIALDLAANDGYFNGTFLVQSFEINGALADSKVQIGLNLISEGPIAWVPGNITPEPTLRTINPPHHTMALIFYPPTVALASFPQTLSPPILTNAQTFFSATVAGTAWQLTAPLLTTTQTFFAPSVGIGELDVSPPLFVNAQPYFIDDNAEIDFSDDNNEIYFSADNAPWYSPTVTLGSLGLVPSLFTNTTLLFSATIVTEQFLTSSLHSETQTFFAATVEHEATGAFVLPPLLTNATTFFAATMSVAPFALEDGTTLQLEDGTDFLLE